MRVQFLEEMMTSRVLEEELGDLPGRLEAVPNTELVACHRSMVQIKVRLVELQLTLKRHVNI